MDGGASGVVVNQRAAEGLDRYVVTKHSNSALLLVTQPVSDAVGDKKAQDYMQQQGRPEAVPCGRTDAPEQAGPPLSRPTRRGPAKGTECHLAPPRQSTGAVPAAAVKDSSPKHAGHASPVRFTSTVQSQKKIRHLPHSAICRANRDRVASVCVCSSIKETDWCGGGLISSGET